MNRKTVYISGPMTGLPDFNRPAFFAAEEFLHGLGFGVINPARNNPYNETWAGYMMISRAQVRMSDYVALLPGWRLSRGAVDEVRIADMNGIPSMCLLGFELEGC